MNTTQNTSRHPHLHYLMMKLSVRNSSSTLRVLNLGRAYCWVSYSKLVGRNTLFKLGWEKKPSGEQDGSVVDLLSDALDGNASVIRPLIYVLIVYIALLFVVLGFISTSRDNEISSVETARFEHFVDGHLKYLSDVMSIVATLASSDLQLDDKSFSSADALLKGMSKRQLANQMFVFSPKGDLLREQTWRTDTNNVSADQINARTRSMLTIATYTGKPVSDIVNVDGDLFVVTV